MSISEKLVTISNNVEQVYNAGISQGIDRGRYEGFEAGYNLGRDDGVQWGKEVCKAKHYSQVIYGDGSRIMEIELPFEPDVLTIITNAPELRLIKNIVTYAEFDFAALGQIVGKMGGTASTNGRGSYQNLVVSNAKLQTLTTWNPPTMVIHDLVRSSESGSDLIFGEGIEYLVLASKFDLKPLNVRIQESIDRLPAQTTTYPAYYQKAKVDSAFTTDEWNELISTKANYTFNLI